jgi:hypothetical protein
MVIDVVGEVAIQIAQRVVGQSCQVDHGIEALQVRFVQVADIFADFRNRRSGRSKITALEQTGVHADHVMTSIPQHCAAH